MNRIFKNVIVELRPSIITPSGIGVFSATSIKKGVVIFEGIHASYFKHLISWKDFELLPKNTKKKVLAFCVGTPKGFIPPDKNNFNELSIEWYLNHSCVGNIGFDYNGDFVTIKDIKCNTELTYDYGLIETNPKFQMNCVCGESKCRKIITGNDWKYLINIPEKFKIMHPQLKKE